GAGRRRWLTEMWRPGMTTDAVYGGLPGSEGRELWSLREDVSVEADPDGLIRLRNPWGVITIQRATSVVEDALRRMSLGPVSLRNVAGNGRSPGAGQQREAKAAAAAGAAVPIRADAHPRDRVPARVFHLTAPGAAAPARSAVAHRLTGAGHHGDRVRGRAPAAGTGDRGRTVLSVGGGHAGRRRGRAGPGEAVVRRGQ